ncbi:hypothetical protein [Streptomyces laurentii]|uniref:hypothetical protein n=1 Tax=Streptomyces laurentii TaxID=39478 RepID=UPI0033FA879E
MDDEAREREWARMRKRARARRWARWCALGKLLVIQVAVLNLIWTVFHFFFPDAALPQSLAVLVPALTAMFHYLRWERRRDWSAGRE